MTINNEATTVSTTEAPATLNTKELAAQLNTTPRKLRKQLRKAKVERSGRHYAFSLDFKVPAPAPVIQEAPVKTKKSS
jgi:hypothetical protein